MSKGDRNSGGKEAKKPKKVKEKILATADSNKGKASVKIGETKPK